MAGEVKDGERIDVYKDRCLKDDYVYNYVYVLCFVIIEQLLLISGGIGC